VHISWKIFFSSISNSFFQSILISFLA